MPRNNFHYKCTLHRIKQIGLTCNRTFLKLFSLEHESRKDVQYVKSIRPRNLVQYKASLYLPYIKLATQVFFRLYINEVLTSWPGGQMMTSTSSIAVSCRFTSPVTSRPLKVKYTL